MDEGFDRPLNPLMEDNFIQSEGDYSAQQVFTIEDLDYLQNPLMEENFTQLEGDYYVQQHNNIHTTDEVFSFEDLDCQYPPIPMSVPTPTLTPTPTPTPTPTGILNSNQYKMAFFKAKLEQECMNAMHKLSSTSLLKPDQVSASLVGNHSQASRPNLQLGSHATIQNDVNGGQLGLSALNPVQIDGDDKLEGETKTTENIDPSEAKRQKRLLGNRESARRSRMRRNQHTEELEKRVASLEDQLNTLLSIILLLKKYSYKDDADSILKFYHNTDSEQVYNGHIINAPPQMISSPATYTSMPVRNNSSYAHSITPPQFFSLPNHLATAPAPIHGVANQQSNTNGFFSHSAPNHGIVTTTTNWSPSNNFQSYTFVHDDGNQHQDTIMEGRPMWRVNSLENIVDVNPLQGDDLVSMLDI